MTVEIITVKNPGDFNKFIGIDTLIYPQAKGYNGFSPHELLTMFDIRQNPLLKHLQVKTFLSMKNNKAAGRIAAIIDHRFNERDSGFFGCYESIDDSGVTGKLLDACAQWLKRNGRNRMVGPVTLNTNQRVGLLIEGFNGNRTEMMPNNPPYYQQLLETNGMQKFTDLLCYGWDRSLGLPDKIVRVASRASKIDGLTMRSINYANFNREVSLIRYILNKGLMENWGYISQTHEEVAALLYYCMMNTDPDLQLLVFIKNMPAGLCLCFPVKKSYTGKKSLRVAILTVLPEYRMKGLESLLIKYILETSLSKGYEEGELSLVHEDNPAMTRIIDRVVGAKVSRRYRIYQRLS